jgi:peroxiredoxin Q/BCP
MKIKEGQKAPTFSLLDQNGETRTLRDYKGTWVLLYCYPKDDTPGCTKEACGIRDRFPDFKKLKLTVLGISPDSVTRHKKFAEKYKLPFSLLADETKETLKAYDAWGKKTFMGREYEGVLRTSFLISPQQTIKKIYEKVKPETHAEEVLNDITKK